MRDLVVGAAAIALVASIATAPARAGGTLRVGMTAADIPLSWGQPDQGFEGFRFMGLMLYDTLINWDMSSADKASGLIPGLAESWEVNPDDMTKWTFHLRKGVKFHDGSHFDANAVLWNFDRLFDKDAPEILRVCKRAAENAVRPWSAPSSLTQHLEDKLETLREAPVPLRAWQEDWVEELAAPYGEFILGPWHMLSFMHSSHIRGRPGSFFAV